MSKRPTVAGMKVLDSCDIQFICQNKLHRVTLRKSGPITLHHHNVKDELKVANFSRALGGTIPKCVQLMQYWKYNSSRITSYTYVRPPHQVGFCKLPYQVRAMRQHANDMAFKYQRYPYMRRGESQYGIRWRARRSLYIKKLIDNCSYPMRLNIQWDSANQLQTFYLMHIKIWKTTRCYGVDKFILRVHLSGLAFAVPERIGTEITMGDDGHSYLTLIKIHNPLETERVNLDNGDYPETATSSEDQAKYLKALRKYRALESTSDCYR